MRVDVDESGCDQQPGRVDFPPTWAEIVTDRGDPIAIDCHVGDPCGRPRTVNDVAATNHQIMHLKKVSCPFVPLPG